MLKNTQLICKTIEIGYLLIILNNVLTMICMQGLLKPKTGHFLQTTPDEIRKFIAITKVMGNVLQRSTCVMA